MHSGYTRMLITTISGKKKYIKRDFMKRPDKNYSDEDAYQELFSIVDNKDFGRQIHVDLIDKGEELPSAMQRIYEKTWIWVIATLLEAAHQLDIPVESIRLEKIKGSSEAKQHEIDTELGKYLEKYKNLPENELFGRL